MSEREMEFTEPHNSCTCTGDINCNCPCPDCRIMAKPIETPAPSRPTEALVDICPKCGFIMTAKGCWLRCPSCDFKLKELPQAAQTVASPTDNPVYRELRQIYCCKGAEFSRPTLEKAWKEIERLLAYAATLEARVPPGELAKQFHESYERLAPNFGYETRKESAKPWADVPENNRKLMTAVCAEILSAIFGAKA